MKLKAVLYYTILNSKIKKLCQFKNLVHLQFKDVSWNHI